MNGDYLGATRRHPVGQSKAFTAPSGFSACFVGETRAIVGMWCEELLISDEDGEKTLSITADIQAPRGHGRVDFRGADVIVEFVGQWRLARLASWETGASAAARYEEAELDALMAELFGESNAGGERRARTLCSSGR